MVLEMLEVLVVLEDLVVFVGGIFERDKSPKKFLDKITESEKKIIGVQKKCKKPLD